MLLTVVVGCNSPALHQSPEVFVLGPEFSMESGVRTFAGLHRTVMRYDDGLSLLLNFDESTAGGKALGVALRLAKLALVDLPITAFASTAIHEVYGHGARGREVGLQPGYHFSLPIPYSGFFGELPAFSGAASGIYTGQAERDQTATLGGIEADYWTAHWLQRRMVRDQGRMHYSQMMLYGVSKMSYATSFFGIELLNDSASDFEGGLVGDVDQYIDNLALRFDRWTPEGREQLMSTMQRGYIWNFIDPTFWLAAYHGLVTYLYKGQKHAELSMLKVGPFLGYIGTRFNLSPFGAEHYIDLMGSLEGLFSFDVYARAGSSGLARYWGLGLQMFGFSPVKGLYMGLDVDVWDQPIIVFDARNLFERPNSFGAGGAVHVEWNFIGNFGLVGKLAYKTQGYLMGQPVKEGLHGYFGLAFYAGDQGASFGGLAELFKGEDKN